MKANYGIDAPTVVRNLVFIGVFLLVLGIFVPAPDPIPAICDWVGATWLVTAGAMVLGSRFFKLRIQQQVVQSLQLTGTEKVMDMGCGRGLMLIGMAKHLPHGRAIGIDLWQVKDQSSNDPEVTRANARMEKVQDSVEVMTGDMRKLPFDSEYFDVVTSSWAIHNIPDEAGRAAAVREAVRVLKPGGRLVIVDIFHSKEYARTLSDVKMANVKVSGPNFLFVVPTRTVSASKPA
ncbi:MAG: class I SAM-dependent methyltransferase [Fimbriimonas sp.]|nr:class I SAM-dependent methyltransferase [Fimbriimonas sp.]